MGTVLSIGGSMLLTLYKGGLVPIWPSPIHWNYALDMIMSTTAAASSSSSHHRTGADALLGAILILASCFACAIWFVIQARMGRTFSGPYTSTAIMCWMATFQCFVVSAAVERERSAWVLGLNIRLYAVISLGLIGSGLGTSAINWCIEKRGPLFVSMFNPLMLVVIAVLGWAILDEELYVGTAIGSVVIVGGLYMVLWGKAREMEKMVNISVEGEKMEGDEEKAIPIDTLPLHTTAAHK